MKQCILRAFAAISVSVFLSASVQAQTAAYTMHILAAGETLSSLAKEYHTTVGDIMRLNGMHSDSKLVLGEKIKIPATSEPIKREYAEEPAVQPKPATPPTGTKEKLTHTVQTGESLYRISKQYNIPVEKLVALNHLNSTGEIKVGQVLVVSDGTKPAPVQSKAETTTTPALPKTQPQEVQQQPAPQPKTAPASNPPAAVPTVTPPVQKQSSVPETTSNNNTVAQQAQTSFTSNVAAPKEGFFTTQFRQNVEGRSEETKSGAAMTFKSASGWADKKFYVLMNDAPPGSIVKVANGNNAVYAKVLWSLGTQKENDGLDFRISTATAAALNITDEKFTVTVTYFQ